MDSINAVTNAIQLSGTQMMAKTVMVQASQSERNELQTQQKQQQQPTRLYVGGLHTNVTERDVESMFVEFGEVDFVDLHREPETGNSKGFAFVQFRDPEAAKRALVQVNGRELAGRPIKVGLVNAATGKAVGPLGEIDEETGAGLSLDAQSRVILMSKLQRDEEAPLGTSTCLMLKHMFTTEEAEEPNFEQDLTEDIKEECAKFGELRHINIDRFSNNGIVFLRFNSVSHATAAHNSLNGRWFGGRMVEAQYVPEGTYLSKFPHAR